MFIRGGQQVKQMIDADNRELEWEVLRIRTLKDSWIFHVYYFRYYDFCVLNSFQIILWILFSG